MTALAEHTETHLPNAWPPRRRRVKPVVATLVVVAIAFAGLMGREAVTLRGALGRERASLQSALTVEAAARRTLSGVHHDTATAVADRHATTGTDQKRAKERADAQAALVRLEKTIVLIKQELTSTEAAQSQIALYAAPRDACVNGVQTATSALQHGDPAGATAALSAADRSCSAALAAATGARYPYDFPDPSVLRVGTRSYAYSTNSGVGNIQVLVSTDLVKWTIVGDALTALSAWASPGATWAPAVLARPAGFVVYYTTRELATGRECISVASATSPVGPFVDGSTAPLVCQTGGSIDPSPFVDEIGNAWLHWKSESTATQPPTIWAQALSPDGLQLTGIAGAMLTPGQSWERGVVEGPSMIRVDGHDYLFYSGGFWTTAGYSEGVASCDGPAGPCHRILDEPVLASSGRLAGPGGGAAFTAPDGRVWLAFHAFAQPDVGYPNSRTLHLASVRVVSGVPTVTPE